MVRRGLFVGMVALDMIYLVEKLPDRNQKIVAIDSTLSAGGPATNAAVTFSHLSRLAQGKLVGSAATLLGVVGTHPLSQIVRADLQEQQVEIWDLDPDRLDSIPTASILVTQATGDRAVISLKVPRSPMPDAVLTVDSLFTQDIKIVLVDGHQMAAGEAIARQAQASGIPVVADCGSWKPGFEKLLPYVDYAICSANFHPPSCRTAAEGLTYLEACHIPHIAITGGEHPIQFRSLGQSGTIEVPAVATVDTLGAGDIFHGAFCHFLLDAGALDGGVLDSSTPEARFAAALRQAAQVASYSCQFFGTRLWMQAGEKFS